MSDTGWRVGRSVGRTLYVNDELVGLMDTPELAEAVVAAIRDHAAVTQERDGLRNALERSVLVMNAVISSPVCHPHNVVMLRDGRDAARAALGDEP